MYLLTGEEPSADKPAPVTVTRDNPPAASPLSDDEQYILSALREMGHEGRAMVKAKAIEELRLHRQKQETEAKEGGVISA